MNFAQTKTGRAIMDSMVADPQGDGGIGKLLS